MANDYFSFKQFTIWQDQCAMKVSTDACLFGAWVSSFIQQQITTPISHADGLCRMADVGTGTGLLSLMIHQKNPYCSTEALEIDPQAAEQARQNILKAGASEQLKVIRADATTFLPASPYHIIVSNPPFYQDDLKANAPKRNWAFHDDTLTLAQLLSFITRHLHSHGYFFLLLPTRREPAATEMMHLAALSIVEKISVKSTPEHPPHRLLLAGRRKESSSHPRELRANGISEPTHVKEICMTNPNGSYSSRFTELMKDYYLTL
ncbi:MAG: tRNA1(Val) (adenine(37)-N6)-methyltransferase [Sphingomonadales bacterium]